MLLIVTRHIKHIQTKANQEFTLTINGVIMSENATTELEKQSLEAHVDLCAQRYEVLEGRLTKIENKVEDIHLDMQRGQASLTKVIIGAAGTVVAGLLSTIVVILINLS